MERAPSEGLSLKKATNELYKQAKFIKEMTQVTPEKSLTAHWFLLNSLFV